MVDEIGQDRTQELTGKKRQAFDKQRQAGWLLRAHYWNVKRTSIIGLVLVLATGIAFSAPPGKPKAKVDKEKVQALTYANAVSHFKAAQMRATEVQKRCTVFFEGEWKNQNVYNYGLIIVENSDEDVQVTFYLTDAHEMNWVTEFVDAPYFTRGETERLFELINKHGEARGQKVGRYVVDFHHWRPRHADILVFSFTTR